MKAKYKRIIGWSLIIVVAIPALLLFVLFLHSIDALKPLVDSALIAGGVSGFIFLVHKLITAKDE